MTTSDSGYVYRHRRIYALGDSGFDRVAFAIRVLRILRSPHLEVAVCTNDHELKIEHGRAWHRVHLDPLARWAIVSIPPHASREDIALALVRLVEREPEPLLLSTLLQAPAHS